MPHVADQAKEKLGRKPSSGLYDYLPDGTGFVSHKASALRRIYFPLCAVDAKGIKSSITPRLSGDIKIDRDRYLTKPVSVEDLRRDTRNFFCRVGDKQVVSLASGSANDASVEAGMLWHKVKRVHKDAGLQMEALNFVPVSDGSVELMRVTVRNISKKPCVLTPTFSLPLFARALANKHDHEHVTSLLQRIEQLPHGVCVKPTMIFNEREHQPNETLYYVRGVDARGRGPVGTFPTAESFYGESGNDAAPEAVMDNMAPSVLPEEKLNGREAMGALRFADETLAPGDTCEYLIVMGIASGRGKMEEAFGRFNSTEAFGQALRDNETYWTRKARAIAFSTGDPAFDAWTRWVGLQPELRRIFGCSFLPEHDYGKGGKGWRDIWQDLLSLAVSGPEELRAVLVGNFAGVRIDGSNATIVGSAPGEFVGDRNAIARVWMDHGVWPLLTLQLYIHQTGDHGILLEENTYYRDGQLSRAGERDHAWTPEDGDHLTDARGGAYRGSVIEHVLVQHLTQFFNVGEHNIMRLEDADWNDGLDMARERGESVAFMSFYGGNFLALADLLEGLRAAEGIVNVRLAVEVAALLDSLTDQAVDYDDPQAKKKFLFETYFPSVQPTISGQRADVPVKKIAEDLRRKGNWIFGHIRAHEMVTVEQKGMKNSWFNGYYDNQGKRLEGIEKGHVRMTLVGQVFPVMSGLANAEEIEKVIQAVKTYLRDERSGGLRLNTDFRLTPYLDLGRAFGFAYGTKENGAFFNHMSVMYAYALYRRGFVREGHDAISSVYKMCADTGKSKIYPGIPEYFDPDGRGHYHYLTGSASWFVLTMLTQVFGVRGVGGDLVLDPKLVKEQFDPRTDVAAVTSRFAGKKIIVAYENPKKLDYGAYKIAEVSFNGEPLAPDEGRVNTVKIKRKAFEDAASECVIRVVLG